MPTNDVTKSQSTLPTRSTDVFDTMRQEMNRLFDTFDRGWPGLPSLLRGDAGRDWLSLDVDVRDEGKAIVIEAELPGVEEKDVSVTLTNGLLTISGEKRFEREEKKDNYYLAERSYGGFRRTLPLPDVVDDGKIEARFDKGVLRVTAAKRPETVKAERRIEIKKN